MTPSYSTDVVIFGGGVAGLWLLNRLQRAGYRTLLLESNQLGAGQTLASQGIIHGGLKYALAGSLSGAANVIASMPQRWRDCLEGNGELDLRGVNVLSEHYYMWSNAGIRSKLKGFFGSKALQGRVNEVAKKDYPAPFANTNEAGTLYQLPDFVVETESLLEQLAAPHLDRILQIDPSLTQLDQDHDSVSISLGHGDRRLHINSRRVVFAAGTGNESLLQACGLEHIQTQRRPLNMLYVRGADLPQLFVHCIGSDFSMNPKLTITSHRDAQGATVWYLGGEVAESGVGKPADQQIQSARNLLQELLPWMEVPKDDWHCFEIDRAEPAMSKALRPDDAVLTEAGPVLVAWPTKLTLAPSLADKVLAALPAATTPATDSDPSSDTSAINLPTASRGLAQWIKP